MNKLFIVGALLLTVLAAAFVVPTRTAGQKGGVLRAADPVPNRYIVVLDKDNLGDDAFDHVVESQGNYLTSVYGGSVKDVFASAIKGLVVEMSPEEAAKMNDDPSVVSIEEDGYVSISSTEPSTEPLSTRMISKSWQVWAVRLSRQ